MDIGFIIDADTVGLLEGEFISVAIFVVRNRIASMPQGPVAVTFEINRFGGPSVDLVYCGYSSGRSVL